MGNHRPFDWVQHNLPAWNMAYIFVPEIDHYDEHRDEHPNVIGMKLSFKISAIGSLAAEHKSHFFPGLRQAVSGDPTKVRQYLFMSHIAPPDGFDYDWLEIAKKRLELIIQRLDDQKPTALHNNDPHKMTGNVIHVNFRKKPT